MLNEKALQDITQSNNKHDDNFKKTLGIVYRNDNRILVTTYC